MDGGGRGTLMAGGGRGIGLCVTFLYRMACVWSIIIEKNIN